MKKSVFVFVTLILLTPSLAFSGIISLKIGFFIPNAKSDIWDIEFENMDFEKPNYYNSSFCFAYEYFATKQLSFTLSIDPYYKNKSGLYSGFTGWASEYVSDLDEWYDFAVPDDYIGDFVPGHSFNVSITPIQFSVKLYPGGRQGKIMPYIGGGVGLYIWYVKIQGDMVNFGDEMYYNEVTFDFHKYNYVPGEDIAIYPVYIQYLQETSRFTFGYHAFAGIMIPVAQRFSFEAEFKYNYARGNFRTGDDADFSIWGFETFDMSGYQISLGLNYWF